MRHSRAKVPLQQSNFQNQGSKGYLAKKSPRKPSLFSNLFLLNAFRGTPIFFRLFASPIFPIYTCS